MERETAILGAIVCLLLLAVGWTIAGEKLGGGAKNWLHASSPWEPVWTEAKQVSCKHEATVSCNPHAGIKCEAQNGGWNLLLDFEHDVAYSDSGLGSSFDIATKVFQRQGTMVQAYQMLVFLKGEPREGSQVVSLHMSPNFVHLSISTTLV